MFFHSLYSLHVSIYSYLPSLYVIFFSASDRGQSLALSVLYVFVPVSSYLHVLISELKILPTPPYPPPTSHSYPHPASSRWLVTAGGGGGGETPPIWALSRYQAVLTIVSWQEDDWEWDRIVYISVHEEEKVGEKEREYVETELEKIKVKSRRSNTEKEWLGVDARRRNGKKLTDWATAKEREKIYIYLDETGKK